ncbi:YbhB/YbcL family Raf kinase inhibitor-like protein [Shewanella sp. GXUN23E]|uniref:YbhB/YbcL family Raf kinase inhibitor-like protein n=1 Tax=Shewanella sp. GXUN23E TaxID=3422498 RepID=UPI003D7E3559
MKARYLLPLLTFTAFAAQAMTISSQDIQEGSPMANTFAYKGFGCSGGNQSPQLSWQGAPAGTGSYAITAYDPDAPTGSGWWHWQVVNIPASVHSLKRDASGHIQGADELTNDYGNKGFGGVCPPSGDGMHRYQFTVWALPDARLELPANASAALVGYLLNAKALDKATLTATYVTP